MPMDMTIAQLESTKSIDSSDYNNNNSFYITYETTDPIDKNGKNITIGSGQPKENKPLQNGSYYTFFQRTELSDGNVNMHKWMPKVQFLKADAVTSNSTNNPKEADTGLDGDDIALMTAGIAIGLIALIFCLICICHYKYSLKYAPKPPKKGGRTLAMVRLSTDPSIPVTDTDFYDHMAHMKFHNFKGFYEEFSQMKIAFQPSEAFRSQHNNVKNRFVNIPCYDDSRCILKSQYDDSASTYIHANFVPGTHSDKDYILTQSPLPETVSDFWQMVWEQNVSTIVMIGEIVEKGNPVCAPYFPTLSNEHIKAYGNISIEKEYIIADYAVRTLSMKMTDDETEIPRTIHHFQFLGWPPVQITPSCPTPFLEFVQIISKSKEQKTNSPIVVHGTTGSGRAGIYACVDAQVDRVLKQNDVNVYNGVKLIREHRYDGVKTLDEYIFIHEAVLEFILKRNIHDIPVQHLPKYIENITRTSKEEPFDVEYGFLSSTVVSSTQKMDAANQPQNKKKNRYENIKPFDDNRVKLSKLVNSDGSDYINASYVDTYAHKKAFIATQAPLVETLSDFWRMIYENESWVIVMLGQEIENGQLKADRFWPEEGFVMALGDLSIKLISSSQDAIKDVVIRQMELMHTKKSETKLIQMYQYLTWPNHEGITSESITSLVQLVHESDLWKTKLKAKTTTVVSSTGIGRPGVLIALRSLQEESENEGKVNVFRTVQKLRQQRAALIQKREEYVLIYTSALEISKHVRRRSVFTALEDVNSIGTNILPNGYNIPSTPQTTERLNSVSSTSEL